MSVEDPFDQVLEDTKEQLSRLTSYLPSHGVDDEVVDIVKDVRDTIDDLDRSIIIMERNGVEIQERKKILVEVRGQLDELVIKYHIEQSSPTQQAQTEEFQPLPIQQDYTINESSFVNEAPQTTTNTMQEQMIQEQDVHLDNIHQTMQNLHLQAETMGQELEDQGQLLDELDNNFDSVTNKLNRSRRQLEWVYEKNKEKFNDCCIVLLIVALIVLLVLAFIA